jgi:hypothetical protein
MSERAVKTKAECHAHTLISVAGHRHTFADELIERAQTGADARRNGHFRLDTRVATAIGRHTLHERFDESAQTTAGWVAQIAELTQVHAATHNTEHTYSIHVHQQLHPTKCRPYPCAEPGVSPVRSTTRRQRVESLLTGASHTTPACDEPDPALAVGIRRATAPFRGAGVPNGV